MRKTCRSCGVEKPVEEFNKNRAMRDGLNSYCKPCHRASVSAYKKANPEWARERARAESRKLRNDILAGYGGRCVCCGEDTPEFLALDHINGGGGIHRRQVGGNTPIYRDVRRRGFPKDEFQLLCHNCNTAKGMYGSCPHSIK